MGGVVLCFACFFRLGELLPAETLREALLQCIQWGNITVDSTSSPSMLRVHLRVSKCDQMGKGLDIYVEKLASKRCPVIAVIAYITTRGSFEGPFFMLKEEKPLIKMTAIVAIGLDQTVFL